MKKTLTTLAIALTMNAFAQIPTTGMVGYWPFTGNASDLSGNNNNGTVNGATLSTDRFGNPNSAYSFNGTSNNINLNMPLPNVFSVSMWVYVNSFKTYLVAGNNYIGSKFLSTVNNTSPNSGFEMGLEGLPSNYGKHGSAFWCSSGCNYALSSNLISLGTWYSLMSTYDGTNLKYFVNGTLDTTVTSSFVQNNKNIFLGVRGFYLTGADFFLDGKIDDVRLYNRVLNPTEINALYNEGICYTNITVTDTLLINTGITGFNPVTYQNTIKVYPNPAHDHITINYGNYTAMSGYTMKITNSLGQVVFTTPINQQTSNVALSTWTGNGMYFVYIIDGTGNTIDVKKIVLQ